MIIRIDARCPACAGEVSWQAPRAKLDQVIAAYACDPAGAGWVVDFPCPHCETDLTLEIRPDADGELWSIITVFEPLFRVVR